MTETRNRKEPRIRTQLQEVRERLSTALRATSSAQSLGALFQPPLALLAEGDPVSTEQLAEATGRSVDTIARELESLPNLERDDEGRVVGMGLTQRPTPHRFSVDDRLLYTWCALDTLMFPALLGEPASVASPCHETGAPVRVEVSAHEGVTSVEPEGAVVSVVAPEDLDNLRSSFCDNVHFFVSARLNKELGIGHAKCARILLEVGGIKITPGGVATVVARAADAAEATYDAICDTVPASRVVAPDETGWRVGGRSAWLHAFVGEGAYAYALARGRGYAEAAAVLGEDYAGVLERDGWAPYRRFQNATHQSCLAHLLRRCNAMIEVADRGQARVPHELRRILLDALRARARSDASEITRRGLERIVIRLQRRVARLLAGRVRHPPNVRLLRHIANEEMHLFTFLKIDGVQATNWRAEHAIRPAVVARNNWGGNRTLYGAHVFEVLASLFRTARQQGVGAIDLLAALLRNPDRVVAPLALAGHAL